MKKLIAHVRKHNGDEICLIWIDYFAKPDPMPSNFKASAVELRDFFRLFDSAQSAPDKAVLKKQIPKFTNAPEIANGLAHGQPADPSGIRQLRFRRQSVTDRVFTIDNAVEQGIGQFFDQTIPLHRASPER
jgi:hypothetical protein